VKTKIIKTTGTWQDVADDCRTTVGKASLEKNPSDNFKRRILISEHSPIRSLSVKWKWENIPSWIATHFSRHKWECFIKTQRTDRTGIDRSKLPQDAPVIMTGYANAQSLIDTARKRLCRMAAPETRKYMEDFKIAVRMIEPQLSDVLVPNCVYRGGCPEMNNCGWYNAMVAKYPDLASTDIQKRYDTYNEVFYGNE
jgi:hypothetical protein